MSEWVVKREALIEAMETLGLIPSRPGIAASEYIRLEPRKKSIRMSLASEIEGYVDLEGASFPFSKEIFIDRRLLDPFVGAAKNIKSKSDFKFSRGIDKQLRVRNGSRKANFTCSNSKQGYSDASKATPNEVRIESSLKAVMLAAKHCSEQNDVSVPEQNCVYVKREGKKIKLYAYTDRIFFRSSVKSKLKLKEPVPFPIFVINLFNDERLKGIEVNEKEVFLDFGNGKIWQTIAVMAKKNFPRKMIDSKMNKAKAQSKLAFNVEAKPFGQIVDRLASYLSSVRRLDWVLTIKGKKGANKIEMIVSLGHTVFKDEIVVKNIVSRDFEIDWPLDRLLGVLGVVASTQKNFAVSVGDNRRSYINADDIELLISGRVEKAKK